jgi:predicted ATPase
LQPQRCSIFPSGFHTPRTHVFPQSQSCGAGDGGAGESTSIEARAADTAAAAFGASRSTDLGSDDSQTRKAIRAFQIPESITSPFRYG